MKAAINRVTDSAKYRDTIGRNKVSIMKDTQAFGTRLFDYQNEYSSDNVEKLTSVILRDETLGCTYILKYRIQVIVGDNSVLNNDNQLQLSDFLQFMKQRKENKENDK